MRQIKIVLLVMLIAVLIAPQSGLAAGTNAEAEIEYLLTSIGESGCTFIRNGTSHSAKDAEAHLRMKYRRGQKYASTAEEFIERLATASSWTKKPYTIDCDASGSTPTGDWLKAKLDAYRNAASTPSESS